MSPAWMLAVPADAVRGDRLGRPPVVHGVTQAREASHGQSRCKTGQRRASHRPTSLGPGGQAARRGRTRCCLCPRARGPTRGERFPPLASKLACGCPRQTAPRLGDGGRGGRGRGGRARGPKSDPYGRCAVTCGCHRAAHQSEAPATGPCRRASWVADVCCRISCL